MWACFAGALAFALAVILLCLSSGPLWASVVFPQRSEAYGGSRIAHNVIACQQLVTSSGWHRSACPFRRHSAVWTCPVPVTYLLHHRSRAFNCSVKHEYNCSTATQAAGTRAGEAAHDILLQPKKDAPLPLLPFFHRHQPLKHNIQSRRLIQPSFPPRPSSHLLTSTPQPLLISIFYTTHPEY